MRLEGKLSEFPGHDILADGRIVQTSGAMYGNKVGRKMHVWLVVDVTDSVSRRMTFKPGQRVTLTIGEPPCPKP